jgi:hypothetical protein
MNSNNLGFGRNRRNPPNRRARDKDSFQDWW